jgi:cell division protein FtsZ
MVLHLSVPELKELNPKITVFGVGGAGGNAINNMIEAGLSGVEFVAANTDAQALSKSLSDSKMQLGVQVTKGLGAGSHPDIGKSSADETKHEIMERLEGTNMLFITAGMGGGTGTGAAPVIARVAKELGILTVAVVTKPFQFEGAGRMRIAEQGLKELEHLVDTTIVIPNQNLFKVADEKTTFADAFSMADDVLHAGVRSITDLMVVPGLINLDFADVETIMKNMGEAIMGTGVASGNERAVLAAQQAISSPLLDDASIKGAQGVLVNITGGDDLTLMEANEATTIIFEEAGPSANIIFGAVIDPNMKDEIRVTVIATGFNIPKEVTKVNHLGNLDQETIVNPKTHDLQEQINKPLHIQKTPDEIEQDIENDKSSKPIIKFDDTEESPVVYGQDLQIPTFIRRQHD